MPLNFDLMMPSSAELRKAIMDMYKPVGESLSEVLQLLLYGWVGGEGQDSQHPGK
jgi:hypothetical protein